ncbi:MAG: PrsW family intramembrane metalloprotease [Patescibacteria group bacterium]
MEYYRLTLYIIFGVLPSLIWLFYYLTKDLHPEPKKTILRVFLFGALATIPTLFIQVWLSESLVQSQYLAGIYLPEIVVYLPFIFKIVKWFLIIALTEEVFKYLVVRLSVYQYGVLDEPLDVMLYMVVSALGFAALENILYLFSPIGGVLSFDQIFKTTVTISFIRFIGATFLHTLSSALVGYFLVKSLFDPSRRLKFTAIGIFLATLLHGLYNFSIMTLREPFNFIISAIILAVLALFIIYDFDEVKKLKGICKL